jgi:hypothetical protein
MKWTLIVFLAFFPPVAFPQQTAIQSAPSTNGPANVTKVIRVQYGIAQKIADLVAPGAPVRVNADNYSKVIVLKGNPNDVASVEQTIRELDVPGATPASYKSKDIELVVSVIGGSDQAEFLQGGQVPEAIAPVVKQLRAVFPYKNYQLLSSMLLRSREGAKAENSGVMRSLISFGNHPHPSAYAVSYTGASISSEEGKPIIHLQNFSFRTSVPTPAPGTNDTQFQPSDIGIKADVDLREGQKIVAGKANIDNSDLALFVVLTARVVE